MSQESEFAASPDSRLKDLEQALLATKHLLAKAQAERDATKAQLVALTEEVEHAHAAVTSGSKKVCSYCLFVCETVEQMQEHLKTCKAHPMRAVEAERDEAEAWRVAVAEGTGFINRADGSSGYTVADAAIVLEAWKQAKRAENDLTAWTQTFDFDTLGMEAGWCGPCAHGRDPYTRCDECAELPLPQLVLKSVNHWSHTARQLERERDAFRAELEKTRADLVRTAEERDKARESERSSVVAHLRAAVRRESWGDLSRLTKHRAVSEIVADLATAIERGEHEPYCACGRLVSACDGSRAGCAKRAVLAEVTP